MRVERFRQTTVRTVKKKCPWAKRVVKVGNIVVAMESPEDCPDLAPVTGVRYVATGSQASEWGKER